MLKTASLGLATCMFFAFSATAGTYTAASLHGEYAFTFADVEPTSDIVDWQPGATGVLVFDGDGAISGRRTVLRHVASGTFNLPTGVTRFTQVANGTYAMDPDGIVSMVITWSPPLPDVSGTDPNDAYGDTWYRTEPVERMDATLDSAGFHFLVEQGCSIQPRTATGGAQGPWQTYAKVSAGEALSRERCVTMGVPTRRNPN